MVIIQYPRHNTNENNQSVHLKEQNEQGGLSNSFDSCNDASSDQIDSSQQLPSTQTSLATDVMTEDDNEFSGGLGRKRVFSEIHGHCSDVQPSLLQDGHQVDTVSPPSLRVSLSFDGEAMVRNEKDMTPSSHKGRNALRISMSSDGKAAVRTGGEPSPSKNRVSLFASGSSSRPAGLRRSNSAASFGSLRAKPSTFGRSRDPRNWGSFFDTDARSALSTLAGSRATSGVISSDRRSQNSLNRSFSEKHSLMPITNTAKGNFDGAQQLQVGNKKRKLSRTVSSLGRLESVHANANPLKENKVIQNAGRDMEDYEKYGVDSDKENWVPGTRMVQNRRRTTKNQGSVLKDSSKTNSKSQRQPQKVKDINAEVSSFMGGHGGSNEAEDLDCIQGLLSLSQGAWR